MGALPFLDLPRARRAQGVMALPGSKSISNRVLLLAAIADGETAITGLLDSDDTRVMLAALRQLGVAVSDLAEVTSAILLGVFVLVNAALIGLKRREPDAPFRVPMAVPVFGLVAALAALAVTFGVVA